MTSAHIANVAARAVRAKGNDSGKGTQLVMTIRRWMVVVAVVALSFRLYAVQRRWSYCRDAAVYYGVAADYWLGEVDTPPCHYFCGTYLRSMTDEAAGAVYGISPVLPTAAEHRNAPFNRSAPPGGQAKV